MYMDSIRPAPESGKSRKWSTTIESVRFPGKHYSKRKKEKRNGKGGREKYRKNEALAMQNALAKQNCMSPSRQTAL